MAKQAADAAGCRVYQDGIAGADAMCGPGEHLNRQAADQDGGGGPVVEEGRQFHREGGWQQAFGGVGAIAGGDVAHPFTGSEAGDAGTDGLDDSGCLDAWDAGQRQGAVEAGADIGVMEVDADGRLADAQFVRAGGADGDRLGLELFGAAVVAQDDCFRHGCLRCPVLIGLTSGVLATR